MSSTVKNHDLVTLGESMWRLSPSESFERLESANKLNIHVGGAESNLAIAMARLGMRTVWLSRLPPNPLGRQIANTLRAHGVDVTSIKWAEGRLGTYFVEFGSAPRATQVIYDRANSAASQMQPDDFDWKQIHQSRWLHLTGITPALSSSCLQTAKRAIDEARSADVPVSLDINYRAKLWSPEQASPVLDELARLCQVVMVAERDARTLFHVSGGVSDILSQLRAKWSQTTIIVTQGAGGSSAYDGQHSYHIPAIPVANPVAIGAGDAFDAGLLCALLENKPLDEALRMGNSLAALKMTISGDIAVFTRAELDAFLQNQVSGVVR